MSSKSMPYLLKTTCRPATFAPLACASSLTSLSRKKMPCAASSAIAMPVVFEAAHRIHAAGAQQFAHQIDQAGAADALRRAVADHAEFGTRRRRRSPRLRSRHRAPACRRRSRRLRTPGRPDRGGQNAVPVAEDQLRVGADVHDRDQAVFVREIDRQHAGRRIRAHVAADDRRAVDARLRMNRQQAAPAGGREAGGGALALRHLDFGDRVVGILADRIDALAGRTDRASWSCRRPPSRRSSADRPGTPRWRASDSRRACASAGRDARVS